MQIWKLLVISWSADIFSNNIDKIIVTGPAGSLIAYAIIGFIVYWVTFSLGEMATYIPVCYTDLILCLLILINLHLFNIL